MGQTENMGSLRKVNQDGKILRSLVFFRNIPILAQCPYIMLLFLNVLIVYWPPAA